METQELQDNEQIFDNGEYAKGDVVWSLVTGEPLRRTVVCVWYERKQKHYLVENGMGAQELVPESFLMLECRASDVLQPSN